MSTSDDIGHRHNLPASGLRPAEEARPLSIRIIVPPDIAHIRAVQLLASCLVNLLARQVGSVREVQVECPATATLVPLPMPGRNEDFSAALCELGVWATGGLIPVRAHGGGDPNAVCVYVGGAPSGADPDALVAVGAGWKAWVGTPAHAPSVEISSENPLGPFLAAALAAGEVFKRSREILRGRYFNTCGLSLWTMRDASMWTDLEDGPPIAQSGLPPAHLVGAGAVGQGLLYTLGAAQVDGSYFVAIDNDKHDGTNLNRCFLAGAVDRKHRKVDAAGRAAAEGFGVHPFFGDWNAFVVGPRPALAPHVEASVSNFAFPLVLSCVDRATSRHQIQAVWPSMILAGRTTNLVAFADVYRNEPDAACLACHNPPERDGARIQELRAQLGEMPPEDLRIHLSKMGVEPEAIEAELRRPTCGSIGEAQLNKLATERPPEFSVGFVSLAAGLMLAANLLKATTFAASAAPASGMVSFSFLHGRFDEAVLSVDHECELKCSVKRQT